MEITDRGVSSLVTREVGGGRDVLASSESSCQVMRAIASLEGVPLQHRTLFAAAAVGAGLRSFDDVFDGLRVDDARTESRKILGVLGGVESVCILGSSVRRPLSIAIDNFGDAARLALLNLTQAQLDSIEQRVPGTTDARIEDISRRKGANTMLLFAMQVNPGMTIERRNCYEELGFLMQLIDDYTDVHIDKAEGVSTLLTGKQSDFERILLLQRQVRKVRALFAAEYPPDKLLDINAYIGLLLEGAGIARMQC